MINDIKWVQAQRKATDWRQAVEIATRPLVAYGAAQPCYVNGIIENTLNWLLLCVSATDANAHILTIQRISQFIDSPQRLTAVGNASTDDALFALVSG